MKRGMIASLAATAIMAATAIVGVADADTAKAASWTNLCVFSVDECAYANGSNAIETKPQFSSSTNWSYPAPGNSAPEEIVQAKTDLCMQVDHDGGNIVIEATCTGASYQLWYNIGDGPANVFTSDWDPSADLCLSYDFSGEILKVDPCIISWYQNFYSDVVD